VTASTTARTVRPELNAREQLVLVGVANGFTNRQIAEQLRITEDQVKGYITSLARRLQARNRAHIAARGLCWRLITAADVPPPTVETSDG
jgi:DNA-binding NarL/FixJ family response regulator